MVDISGIKGTGDTNTPTPIRTEEHPVLPTSFDLTLPDLLVVFHLRDINKDRFCGGEDPTSFRPRMLERFCGHEVIARETISCTKFGFNEGRIDNV